MTLEVSFFYSMNTLTSNIQPTQIEIALKRDILTAVAVTNGLVQFDTTSDLYVLLTILKGYRHGLKIDTVCLEHIAIKYGYFRVIQLVT